MAGAVLFDDLASGASAPDRSRYRTTTPKPARQTAKLLALLAAVVALSCDSPVVRFLAYVWSPDRVRREGTLTIQAEGLEATVTVWFDEHAVPHVLAPDEVSLAYTKGYLHARDRRFQMEALRLAATGRLREMVGQRDETGVLETLDVTGRMVGFEEIAERWVATAPREDLVLLEAYSKGVNAATAREPVGMEFRLLDHRARPWTPRDTVAVLLMFSFGMCKNWQLELGRLELIVHQLRTGGDIERALKIWKPRYHLPPHLIGEKPSADPFADLPPIAPELVEYLCEWVVETAVRSGAAAPRDRRRKAPTPAQRAGSRSNNWVLSGGWTGTGKAALACDPHMVHAMPPMGYLMHVRAERAADGPVEVIGAGFPGLPSISFGTNGVVAWGVTANWADVADLYVEKEVEGRPGFYLFEGRAEPFVVRTEAFRIRREGGGFDTETRRVRKSRHGVILNDFVERIPDEFPLVALRWSSGTSAFAPMRELYSAESVGQARGALTRLDAIVGHWLLGDEHGDIGYVGTVNLPRRRRHLGTLPVPGWTGTYEWDGVVPASELPWIENPSQGFLYTANQQVVQPESQGYPLDFDGDIHHRAARIAQVLAQGRRGRAPAEATRDLQLDDLDPGHAEVLAVTRSAVANMTGVADPLVAKAAQRYLSWDGRAGPESVGATIDQSLCAMLVRHLLEDELRPETLEFVLTFYNIEPLFYDLLTDPDNPAWDNRRTDHVESPDDVVEEVFRLTVAALSERYGADIGSWTWTRAAPFWLRHPFGRRKLLAPLVNRGPFPTRGTGSTVFKHQFARNRLTHFPIEYGPVLRVNIDLADLDGSVMQIPGGQSGRPASKHYADLLPLFMEGRGVSMRMGFDRIEERSVGKLVLRP